MTNFSNADQPSLESCIQFLSDELARLDGQTEKQNTQYTIRNILYYAWILQKQHLAAERSLLAKLVGIPEGLIDQMITYTLSRFVQEAASQAIRLCSNMMKAIEIMLNDPDQLYFLTDPNNPLPYFGDFSGLDYIRLLNELDDSSNTIDFSNQVMSAFSEAIPGVRLHVLDRDVHEIRAVVDQDERWYFLLVVITNKGMLDRDAVQKIMGLLFSVETPARNLNQHFKKLRVVSNPNILLFAPAVDRNAEDFAAKHPELKHIWAFSGVRFFRLLKKVFLDFENNQDLIVQELPAIFTPQLSPTVYSVRAAIDFLREAIKKKLPKQTRIRKD